MTIDISKVKVGDKVTARFEDEVVAAYPGGDFPFITTRYGINIYSTDNDHFFDVTFTTPKPPLPTAPGSVISVAGIFLMLKTDKTWISNMSGSIYRTDDVVKDDYVIKYDAGADNG